MTTEDSKYSIIPGIRVTQPAAASTTTHHHHNTTGTSSSQQHNVFGPNRSAISMLKQLRFSPFVATNIRRESTSAVPGDGSTAGDQETEGASGGGVDLGGSGGGVANNNNAYVLNRAPTSPWEFFTPAMTKYYAISTYVYAVIMFATGVAATVARYKSKPNSPIECDYKLDQSLSWLAGLMLPMSLFAPVWMMIFLQHIYPPLYQASRVPLERTFRHFNHFIGYSTFLAIFLVAIFASCLYALSVAKSWDFVEHEACGYSFTMLRSIAIIGIASIGTGAVAHFIHWAYLNSKLDNVRGVLRPLPSSEGR